MTTEMQPYVTTAYVQGEELVLEDFRERDPEVVAFAREADEVETAVHRCLTIGARALRIAGATLDSQLVEHRFEAMTAELERSVQEFASRVEQSAEGLLSEEDGELRGALGGWLAEVEGALGAAFDENSKTSVIGKLERVLADARDQQVTSVRRLLDPAQPDSPIGQWRREIVDTLGKELGGITAGLDELTRALAVRSAEQKVMEKTAVKGFAYEDIVLETLERVCEPLQDVPAAVGHIGGDLGTKVGDIVVEIDPMLVHGCEPRYVVECKDRKLTLKSALDELDRAIENRSADAGLIVFARAEQSPCSEPFHWYDHKALVVLDKDDPDPAALRLACLWARWVCIRDQRVCDPETVDTARIAALLDSARTALRATTTIRGCNTKAHRAIDDATGHLDALDSELRTALDEIAAALG